MEVFILEMQPRGEDQGKGPTFINDKTFVDRLRKAADIIEDLGARNTQRLWEETGVTVKFINRRG